MIVKLKSIESIRLKIFGLFGKVIWVIDLEEIGTARPSFVIIY